MQYIHANITNPLHCRKCNLREEIALHQWATSHQCQNKDHPCLLLSARTLRRICGPDLPAHPLRPGFILFFISRFHRQYAGWINKAHKPGRTAVRCDGAWTRTRRGTEQDLGPRCNTDPFHCRDQRQSAVRQHLQAQRDRDALLCPPRATVATLYEIFTDYWREIQPVAKKRLNESKHESSDTWRTREREAAPSVRASAVFAWVLTLINWRCETCCALSLSH